MKNTPRFVDEIAAYLLDKTAQTVVVVPSKRAKVFLIDAIAQQSEKVIFAPSIISIEEFVQQLSGFQTLDPIDAVFEFYQIYLENTPEDEQQDFESFMLWAPTLLQDFNEIDRYLLNANSILDYLKAIEDIKHWSVDPAQQTDLIQRYLVFWNRLNKYYHAFESYLISKKYGYQGLIYRQAVDKLPDFIAQQQATMYCFVGFNALNAAEERIVQELQAHGLAEVFWDVDRFFVEHPQHDAGLFLRRYKKNWPMYRTQTFKNLHDYYSAPKELFVYGTPKAIGQAKLVGLLVKDLLDKGKSPSDIAIVLGEERLLLPVLHALPKEVGSLNITMGYSAKNSPVQIFFGKLIKLHMHAIQRKGVFYYRELLDVVGHPLVEPFFKSRDLREFIQQNNISFVSSKRVLEKIQDTTGIASALFTAWDSSVIEAVNRMLDLLNQLKEHYQARFPNEVLTLSFMYAQHKVLTRVLNYLTTHPIEVNWNTFYSLYKQIANLGEISFEGEPLNGLQIMGVLESRVLDFDTVIVTTLNEGTFPAGKGAQSFIPQDVKFEYNLPTYKEKDAIYTYHFYHLLQRCNSAYLIYNTETDGMGSGERSRFITQLKHELRPNHVLREETFTAAVPPTVLTPVTIAKTDQVMQALERFSSGISPSSLTSYMRDPIKFYMERVLRVREVEEVEELIQTNTLGTIIHLSLENLYTPYLEVTLTTEIVDSMLGQYQQEVLKAFQEVYKEGNYREGQNLLAFEVSKRYVLNFLTQEKADIAAGHLITVLGLEQEASRELELTDGRKVMIKGNIDRVERRQVPSEVDVAGYTTEIRIIDYKSGKVEDKNLNVSDWKLLTQDIKFDKAIQVLCYAYMKFPDFKNERMRVGIVSFKNLKKGFMGFSLDKAEVDINSEILAEFTTELVSLIEEILDPSVPFSEQRLIKASENPLPLV